MRPNQKLIPLLATLALAPGAVFGSDLILQTVQFPEDRDIDVEMAAIHPVPGTLEVEVEYEDGDAEVRFDADRMVPALALGGDVTSYVAWAVPRNRAAERLGELRIFDGSEKTELETDLKEFALLVTLEEHAKVTAPSGAIVFQNLPVDEKGARSEATRFAVTSERPAIGPRVRRPRADDRAEFEVLLAERQFEMVTERAGSEFAAERERDARVALGQAHNFLVGGREKEAIDYAQRSRSASADVLLARDQELARQDRLAQERAEQAEKDALARRATSAEMRGERLEVALDRSERTRESLEDTVEAYSRRMATMQSQMADLERQQSQAETRLEATRIELQALDLERRDARERADELMAERARLSARVGELAGERESLSAQRDDLVAQQADLQKENADLAQQKAAAEAEAQRLAEEKAAAVADLYGTLSEIADTRRSARGLVMSLPDVLFDFDKATLRPEGTATLAKLAGVTMLVPELELSIEGHTDAVGAESYNDWLSEARASSVADYLVQEGVAPERLETEGFGEEQPIASNDTAEGRQRNRRVEIVIDAESLPERRASIE